MKALDQQTEQGLFFYPRVADHTEIAQEILEGLRQKPRRIHPKFFYDSHGSQLFDRITELPEYYPTRAEKETLRRYRHVIAAHTGGGRVLIEPGSGSSEKVALLIDALRPSAYVAIDIAGDHMRAAGRRLTQRFPGLECHALVADHCAPLQLPQNLPRAERLIFYPGSSIGNFDPPAAVEFLRRWRKLAGPGSGLLIGVDCPKDDAILNAAYNDRQGITAAFNKNVLRHVNRLADGDFNLDVFDHVAFYNRALGRVEMHLESRCDHPVRIAGATIRLRAGERIHTESSYKYTTQAFAMLAATAGFQHRQTWRDSRGLFAVHYLVAAPHVAPGTTLH